MLVIEGKPFLPGFKEKPFAEFEEKMLDPVDNAKPITILASTSKVTLRKKL